MAPRLYQACSADGVLFTLDSEQEIVGILSVNSEPAHFSKGFRAIQSVLKPRIKLYGLSLKPFDLFSLIKPAAS